MVRMIDTRVEIGRHFIASNRNIQGSEGNGSGSSCKYR